MKFMLLISAGLLTVSCATSASNGAWTSRYVSSDEKVMCQKELANEEFFVARTKDKVKLGYRLDMAAFRSTNAVLAGWAIVDAKGSNLVAQIPPESLVDQLSRGDKGLVVESVQLQTLKDAPDSFSVRLSIKKCPREECDWAAKREGEVEYTVAICP